VSEMNIPPDEITSIEDIQKLAVARFDNWSHYGHVTVRKSGQLLIFNYNTMAQYEARGNFFELVSRGLIINANTGEIVARPFDKFFNWFEGGRRAKGHMISVTEKVDGSIGILYRAAEGYRVATRGHFSSPQAEWATAYQKRCNTPTFRYGDRRRSCVSRSSELKSKCWL
jgi:RNA ligase